MLGEGVGIFRLIRTKGPDHANKRISVTRRDARGAKSSLHETELDSLEDAYFHESDIGVVCQLPLPTSERRSAHGSIGHVIFHYRNGWTMSTR